MTEWPSAPAHDPTTYAGALGEAHLGHGRRYAFRGEDGDVVTYEQATGLASRIIGGLLARHVRPGDRVLLALDNHIEAVLVERAVMLWGLVRVAVSARLHPREISWIAHDCQAAVLIVEPRHLGELDPALTGRVIVAGREAAAMTIAELCESEPASPDRLPGATPDGPAAIMYTSGTTGRPKGAVTTQRAWRSMAGAVAHLLTAVPADVVAHVAPYSHFSGSVASGFAISGATVAALRHADPATLPERLRALEVTCVPLVPTMIGDLVRAHEEQRTLDLPRLRAIPYGGSTIAVGTARAARALLGDVLVQFYGASEALIPITYLDRAAHGHIGEQGPVPAGRPGPGFEVRLAGGPIGEILVRGDRTMTGYWNKPARTRDVLDKDGWYHTGDVGELDADGVLTIVGRSREVIISGGFNVYPGEIERVIRTVNGVLETKVVRCGHERWGEGVAAAVVIAPGATVSDDDIIDACRAQLASYKKPVRIAFLDELPRTSTGKLDVRRIERIVERQKDHDDG